MGLWKAPVECWPNSKSPANGRALSGAQTLKLNGTTLFQQTVGTTLGNPQMLLTRSTLSAIFGYTEAVLPRNTLSAVGGYTKAILPRSTLGTIGGDSGGFD